EHLECRVVPSTLETLKSLYAPGAEVALHVVGLAAGETVALQVTRTDAGSGTPHVTPTWLATDRGGGDFGGAADRPIHSIYTVPDDVTSASFQVTASATLSRTTAQTTFQADDSEAELAEHEPAPKNSTTTITSSAPTAPGGQAVTFTASVSS